MIFQNDGQTENIYPAELKNIFNVDLTAESPFFKKIIK
jgi:hypothetical protein